MGKVRCVTEGQSAIPPLWLSSAQKIEDAKLRSEVASAADRSWQRWTEDSESDGVEATVAIAALDHAVGAAVAAGRTTAVRDPEAFLFKSLLRKARKLLRREQRIEYRDFGELAKLDIPTDANFVESLERWIQVKEFMALMDERTRTIFVMDCQGFARHETARVLGMSEDAVRKSFARGVERLRRLISSRTPRW
jgi:Sigma-70, region 4